MFELFPVIAFFCAYFFGGRDFYVATIVLMVAVAIQIATLLIAGKPISNMLKMSAVLVLVLGAVTIFFQNPLFLKWKTTVLYWLFAAIMAGSVFVGEKPVLEHLMGGEIDVERTAWARLTIAWAGFFAAFGGLNLFVAYRYEEATWVKFKLFGFLGATVVMAVATAIWLSRFMPQEEDS
ncbi:MAG: inner membrane-spanning protein YciB [Pseudomonadota bacterium]